MSPPLLPQDITMTSETEETVLDLRSVVELVIADLRTEKNAWAGTGAYAPMNSAANRLAAALSRAPEVEGVTDEQIDVLAQAAVAGYFSDRGTSVRRDQVWQGMSIRQRGDWRRCVRSLLAALSPPSTGGEGEAVAWRCLNVHGDAFLTEDANGAHFWLKSGKPVQPLYLHPSPEMGEIARDLEQAWQVLPADDARAVEARSIIRSAIQKLKENGLSREELGGSARAGSGAAGPSDCAEGDARLSDGTAVAWRVSCANGEWFYQTEKPTAFNPAHVEPLYLHPSDGGRG